MDRTFGEERATSPAGTGRKAALRWMVAGAIGALAGCLAWLAMTGGQRTWAQEAPTTAPAARQEMRITGGTPVERGRYLVVIGGCNDCHTPGFMEKGMAVPEAEWLTGVPVGWRGPWGTTYAANLRLTVQTYDENSWVRTMRLRNVMPPMPWPSLNQMSEDDLKAIYAYVKSLGAKGERMPMYVPPSKEPTTPYLLMVPQDPKGAPAEQPAR